MTTTGKRATRRSRGAQRRPEAHKPTREEGELLGHVHQADHPRLGWHTYGDGRRSRAATPTE